MKQVNRAALLMLLLLNILLATGQASNWKVPKIKNEIADRSECGMAAINGKLYLVGGDGGGPQPVACFDTKTLTWTMLAQAPVNMHHFEAVAYNNKVYVLEAFSAGGFPNQEPLANVYSYNTENNNWQKEGEMPAARRRAGAGAAVYQGKLYLVAGIQHGHASGTTNMFDVYDPATQTWTVLPDAPHIRDHCSATVMEDKLYVAGGRNTSFRDPENKITFFSQTVVEVDCYDFTTGKWTTLPAKLPLGSGGGAVVNVNGVLYYMGGERATATENNAPRKNVYYLNPSSGEEWKTADTLHFGRNGMAAAAVNNVLYVAGGSGGGFGGAPGMPPPGGFNPNNNMPPPQDTAHRPSFPPPNGKSKLQIEVLKP